MYSTILVPTDGSEGASEAAAVAVAMAAQYAADLHALYVVDERFVATDYDMAVTDAKAEGEAALDSVGSRGEDAGVRVEKHIRQGVPHDEILDAVDDYGTDLVVMGKHGRTGIERFLHVGSVTERVVQASPVQVLTVPIGDGTE
jgi:nucleotide-binding universal stress UspA family protein